MRWAQSLSYGDQRRLEIARALATRAEAAAAGRADRRHEPAGDGATSPASSRGLRAELGLTILLIEHDMSVVMGVSDRVTVLDYGTKIAEGTPARGPARPEGDRGVSRHGGGDRMSADAGGDDPRSRATSTRYYGNIHALKGITLTVRRRRDRDADRLQRRRQDDDAAHDLRAHAARAAGTIASTGKRHHAHAAAQDRRAGHLPTSPEGRSIFPRMTVTREPRDGRLPAQATVDIGEDMERVFTLFPAPRRAQQAEGGTLSGGEQQMLAIGRALMARPKLLMLDEPSLGLAPILVQRIFEIDRRDQPAGHDDPAGRAERADGARRAAAATCLETGHVALQGPAQDLKTNEQVRKTYLGEG